MANIQIPGLIDAHVHLREPGYEHKEDFYSGTAAALAGGVTMVLDMPNTVPPTDTPEAFEAKADRARSKSVCDVGLFVGATTTHVDAYLPIAHRACGLKIYVSDTFGSLRIESLGLMHRLFRSWAELAERFGYRHESQGTGLGPIAVHAEELMLPVCLNLSHLYDVPLHVVHVSRRSEIELLRLAKERGYPVTCEATPHHLFLSAEDGQRLGTLGDMRPRLASLDDVAALWEHIEVIDVFATDHAPHTLEEKRRPNDESPPGVPGVETMLPLLLTAVHDGQLTIDDVVRRCVFNPRRIYGLPEQPDTYIEFDPDEPFTIRGSEMLTRVGWTPFEGRRAYGRVQKVVLRGETAFADGEIRSVAGTGHVLF